jgi:hypothetical protein
VKIDEYGGVKPLIELLKSEQIELYLSSVYVLWNLATHGQLNFFFFFFIVVSAIVHLTLCDFNNQKKDEIRDKIVQAGVIPHLLRLLEKSDDDEVLTNATSLLWNIAEEGKTRNFPSADFECSRGQCG